MKFKKHFNLNALTSKRQWVTVCLAVLGIVLFFWMGWSFLTSSKPKASEPSQQETAVADADADKNMVNQSMSAQMSKQSNQLLNLQQMIKAIQTKNSQEKAELNNRWQAKFHQLELKQTPVQATGGETPVQHTQILAPVPTAIQMQVIKAPHKDKPLPISSHVTAGTSATALVLSGAATDAGASGQGNTVPIRLKIETQGRLPNGHHSSLKGCFLTASAYGNVSSERGEIRLQRISCVRPNGKVIEKEVKGTVVDHSGMNGISGNTVMRNAPMLWNAGISGFLSGVGSGLSAGLTTQSTSPLGTTSTIASSDIFKNGAYQGGQTALNKLSDYYIKMADLYHPVVEVHAGQYVDIFFLKGFTLDVHENSTTVKTYHTADVDGFASLPYYKNNAPGDTADLIQQAQSTANQIKTAQGVNHV